MVVLNRTTSNFLCQQIPYELCPWDYSYIDPVVNNFPRVGSYPSPEPMRSYHFVGSTDDRASTILDVQLLVGTTTQEVRD